MTDKQAEKEKPKTKPEKPTSGIGSSVRLNVEIPNSLHNAIRVYAASKRVSKKEVVEQALLAYLNPTSEDNRDAMIARRLYRIDQKLLALVEGSRVNTETLAVWIQFALGLMPEPSTAIEKKEFKDKMNRRWPRFIDHLTGVLAERTRGIYSYLPKQIIATKSDFPEHPADSIQQENINE